MTNRLSAWGPAAVWAAVLFFLSALHGVDDLPYLFPGEDKVVHVGLYGVLGATLVWGRLRATSPPPVALLVCLGVLYGASDEWHQAFVPGRDPSLGDWIADTVGVLLGYWITSMIVRTKASRQEARHLRETTPGPKPE